MEAERLILEIAARDLTGDALQAVVRSVGEIRKAAVDSSRAFGEMGSKGGAELDKVGKAFGDIAKIGAGVFAGLKLNDVVNDLADFHVQTMANVAGLGSLADRFGITTDQLQAYQSAARVANVTSDELNKTLATFNLNMGKASAGSKEQLEALEKLGVKILDSQGRLRPLPELLNEVSRALLNVENASQRTAIASALVGDKGARLTPLMRELATPIADLVTRGKEFGEIVDREVIDKLDRSKNASEAAKQQFTALYATVAAPLHAQGLEYLASLTGTLVANIRNSQRELERLTKQGYVFDTASGQYFNPKENRAKAIEQELKSLDTLMNHPARQGAPNERLSARRAALQSELSEIRKAASEVQAAANAADVLDGLGSATLPPGTPRVTEGASNTKPKGGEKRDRIGEAINQLRGEAEAAAAALKVLNSDSTTPLDKLEREVELRKRIADEIAKLGKYDPKDPRVAQIKDLVREHENLESSLQKRKKAMQDATEIETRMGDGTLYLRTEQERLNEALATGRLNTETYAAQMKVAADQAELMRLKLEGQKEGWAGVVAGMEYAAKQQAMANSGFMTGQRIYQNMTDSMIQASANWRRNAEVDLQSYLFSFLEMIAQMEMRAAASNIWNAITGKGPTDQGLSGSVGGWLSDLFGGGGGGGPVATTPGMDIGFGDWFSAMGFAGGGRPPLDRASIIGERGPEFFLPDTAGRVIPMGDESGGPSIVINMTNQVGSVVSRAELEQFGVMVEERAKRGAIAGVADAKTRGGSYRENLRR